MTSASRPDPSTLLDQSPALVPFSLQRIIRASSPGKRVWIGPAQCKALSSERREAYALAHEILMHICIQAPLKHNSGHPGGPLSAGTLAFGLLLRRDPGSDAPLRMSAGHLSLLAYTLQWFSGRYLNDPRLSSPEAIITGFRTIAGLPGHAEAGIGDIPFGFGPLGKGLSNGVGHALGWRMQNKTGITDVLMGDGDSQEGQVMEAARLASRLKLDRLVLHADVNDIQLSDLPSNVASCDLAALFSSVGWTVIEVQNGNDPAQVEAALDAVDQEIGNERPVFVCYYTTMGHGVAAMEAAANAGSSEYHGSPMKKDIAESTLQTLRPLSDLVAAFAPHRNLLAKKVRRTDSGILSGPVLSPRVITTEKGAVRKDLGAVHILRAMECDDRIVVLHGDLASSGGFDAAQKQFPDRVINCGAAEANMYMMAAGLRQSGLLPITYTFAAFGTNEARANARLIDINSGHVPCGAIHDCTHAGLSVGEDGETHQDRNYLNIPFDHTDVWVPADSNQAAAMLERALTVVAEEGRSVFLFSGRAGHPQVLCTDGKAIYDEHTRFDCTFDILRGVGDIKDQLTIVTAGALVHTAIAVADHFLSQATPVSLRVLNAASIRPFDASSILAAALETRHLVILEDHHSEGGIATCVADVLADFQVPCSLRRLGVNHYFPSGPVDDLLLLAGLDTESVVHAVEDELCSEVCGGADVLTTALFTLHSHLSTSRFRLSAKAFLERILSEDGYLETLRALWEAKSCPPDHIPSNRDIRDILRKNFPLPEGL